MYLVKDALEVELSLDKVCTWISDGIRMYLKYKCTWKKAYMEQDILGIRCMWTKLYLEWDVNGLSGIWNKNKLEIKLFFELGCS